MTHKRFLKKSIHTHTHTHIHNTYNAYVCRVLWRKCSATRTWLWLAAVWRKLERYNLYIYNESANANPHHFLLHMVLHHMMVGRDLREGGRKGGKGGKGGHQETFVVRPFEGSRFGSGVDTRYLQATWVWGSLRTR